MSNVTVLNITALKKAPRLVVTMDGERHEMSEPTVDDVITTIEDMEKLAEPNLKMSEQMKIMLRVVLRSFPTITEEVMRKRPMEELKALFDASRGDVEIEEEDGAGNASPAS